VNQYVHRRDLTVEQIAQTHNIHASTLMKFVREAGVPTRYGKTLRRWST
jgi:transposase-like protein